MRIVIKYLSLSTLMIGAIILSLTAPQFSNADVTNGIVFDGCCMVRQLYCGSNEFGGCTGVMNPPNETCMENAGCMNAQAETNNILDFYDQCSASSPKCDGNLATMQLVSYTAGGRCIRDVRTQRYRCSGGAQGSKQRQTSSVTNY